MKKDDEYMKLALELAEKGRGRTNPNPMVGAVIVKDGEIIGRGFHEKCGELHAERNAFLDCEKKGNNAEGAVMYVTLEPCCHYGKTPPCTEAIIAKGIKKVVVGAKDTNPLVGGKGIRILQEAGIEVEYGVMEKECRELNRIFFHYMEKKMPYVAMKYAMTSDGKIAAYTGKSKWITGDEARKHVHRCRSEYMGIMVGIGTVLKDDPMLNVRLDDGEYRNPVRIICDSDLNIPLDSKLVKTAGEIRTIIGFCKKQDENVRCEEKSRKYEELEAAGCELVENGEKEGHIDLKEFMEKLGQMGIDSILLEGGGTLNYAALKENLVDYIYCYVAPKILGGKDALTPVEGRGAENPGNAVKLKIQRTVMLGEDLLIEQKVIKA